MSGRPTTVEIWKIASMDFLRTESLPIETKLLQAPLIGRLHVGKIYIDYLFVTRIHIKKFFKEKGPRIKGREAWIDPRDICHGINLGVFRRCEA